ncbi:YraN family protein [Clostridium sp. BJN0001]|uniref:YraN family protein n=1 Tax=Clostridium sp. BJN0001 TaxID=2930219 RepID=UPI001FD13950|nr:YraN family protein [Clostridium sp. BJN0001]
MKYLNRAIGSFCEDICCNYLKNNKYKILDRNFRNRLGELDIICLDNRTIVIIEVKGRFSLNYGTPLEAVNYNKRNIIIKLTKYYLYKKQISDMNIRFDIIEVYLNNKKSKYTINHIKDAFRLY